MKYIFAACLLQIVWSLTPSASHLVIQELPVELYASLRWTISGLLFLAITLIRHGRIKSSSQALLATAGLGVLGYGLASIGTLYSLKTGGVVNFALVGSVSPIVTALIAAAVLRESFSQRFLVCSGVCTVGLILLVAGKYQVSSAGIAFASAALVFGAYVLEAFPFIYSKKFAETVPLVEYMAIAQLSAAGFMWVSQIFVFQQFSDLALAATQTWWALVYVSVVSCALCYFAYYWLLNHMEGHKLALFDGLHTVFGALFGFLFFKDQFNSAMLFGGALLLVGLYFANSRASGVAVEKEKDPLLGVAENESTLVN